MLPRPTLEMERPLKLLKLTASATGAPCFSPVSKALRAVAQWIRKCALTIRLKAARGVSVRYSLSAMDLPERCR